MGCGKTRPNPVRIALITPEYPGYGPSFGIGRYVADLAEVLRAAGHTVRVLAATDQGGVVIGEDRAFQSLPRSLFLRSLTVRTWLLRELEAFQPDVVEASNWGALTAFLPPRWPVVVRLSTSAADAGGARWDPLRLLRVLLERCSVIRAGVVVADSRAMARRCAALYGREADTVIPHAWHGPLGEMTGDRPPAVVFVGRWEPRKGVDVLLACWPLVLAAVPEARLHVVGGGQPRDLGGPGITAHGRLDAADLAALRHRCRIQVVPSRFESFGLVVLEAWAAGLVPVVSSGGALPEVVGDAGVVVPVGDVAALAQGIITTLLTDSTAQVVRGREHVQMMFAPEPLAVRNVAVFQQARRRHGAV